MEMILRYSRTEKTNSYSPSEIFLFEEQSVTNIFLSYFSVDNLRIWVIPSAHSDTSLNLTSLPPLTWGPVSVYFRECKTEYLLSPRREHHLEMCRYLQRSDPTTITRWTKAFYFQKAILGVKLCNIITHCKSTDHFTSQFILISPKSPGFLQ